jgi:hypothetical protein
LVVPATSVPHGEEAEFVCPNCRSPLDSRRTRRARIQKQPTADTNPADATGLTDEQLQRCAEEWARAQDHLGNLGVMAESHWALDWAERLLAEIRKVRGLT